MSHKKKGAIDEEIVSDLERKRDDSLIDPRMWILWILDMEND